MQWVRLGSVIAVAVLTLAADGRETAAKGKKGNADKSEKAASDPAGFLIKPAEDALAARKYGLAVSLWRGVVAIRGDGDPAVWKLAEAWTLAGEFESAIEELERFSAATGDKAEELKADEEIEALRKRPEGFTSNAFTVEQATKQATEAFKRGRKLYAAKKYADAVAMFKAGSVMAPDMPGSYRELGEAYDKLGKADEATAFFLRYLRLRPFGKNADAIRKRLEKAGVLGKLSIESSVNCEQVVVNRLPLGKKLPALDLVVAPGRYRILCYNEALHFAHYLRVDVTKGKTTAAKFQLAILENGLDPWGRIVLEDADNPGDMKDIGLWKEIAVPVPDDRRALKVKLRSADGTKTKETLVKLEPGKRLKIEW